MKDKSTTVILAFVLGGLGAHRFYLGQNLLGFLYLIFCWTFIPLFIAILDFIIFALMSTESFDRKYNPHIRNRNEAFSRPSNKRQLNVAKEIKELNDLREQGIISDDEFEIQKEMLLNQ